MKAIPSTFYQKIKFLTSRGIKEVIGDQAQAPKCYFNAFNSKGKQENQHRVSMVELKLDILEDLEEVS